MPDKFDLIGAPQPAPRVLSIPVFRCGPAGRKLTADILRNLRRLPMSTGAPGLTSVVASVGLPAITQWLPRRGDDTALATIRIGTAGADLSSTVSVFNRFCPIRVGRSDMF
jgi:hypothetical protein